MRSQAVEDRQALNVRREGLALLDRLVVRAKRLERALATDDIAAVASILDGNVGADNYLEVIQRVGYVDG